MRGVELGADVHYVSRTGKYELAAKVSATKATLFPGGVAAGHLPDLTEDQVHLTVFSPGPNENQGGTYTEWAIPLDPQGGPGTFHDPLMCPFGVGGGVPG